MHVYMFMWVWAGVCKCVGTSWGRSQKLMLRVFLVCSPPCWGVSCWTWNSLVQSAKLKGQQGPGLSPMLYDRHATALQFLHESWGSKLSSCLCSKHFTNSTCSPASLTLRRVNTLFLCIHKSLRGVSLSFQKAMTLAIGKDLLKDLCV